ncbi:MAG: hypothetical protein QNJ14_16850 [Woeseiaceae bacterium]|nr:hypothetical protein [Woeseiaceae bacterium]
MSKDIQLQDFAEIALKIKPILVTHDVPAEYHYSIISDIVFEFAASVDTRTGTSFHESIYALLEDQVDALNAGAAEQHLFTDLQIEFGNGDVVETNFPHTQLEDDEQLRLNLEFTLSLRDIDEIDEEIDVTPRFKKLMTAKQGIRELRILPGTEPDADAWVLVSEFEPSIDGLMASIRKIA